MRDKVTERCGTYDDSHVLLGNKRVADIVITNHAKMRYSDRVERNEAETKQIAGWVWKCLKEGRVTPYYRNGEDVYLIDDDLVMVAEFATTTAKFDSEGMPLDRMIIVTFLGRMSETMELRDLKSYYSWLRHSRRSTLLKNSRKRR
ncbi:hypothetical protein D3C78_679570 [compost metagenome]